MSVENWSDQIVLARLSNDPLMSEDLVALDHISATHDVLLDFTGVSFINSSQLARILKLRKKLITNDRRLILCCVGKQVWGAFLVTGLEKVFHFANDVPNALANLQIR